MNVFVFPPLQRRHTLTGGHLRQDALLTKRNIMAAILQTPGPVSSHGAINRYWKFLRCSTVKQFTAAGTELERLNLGRLVGIKAGTREVQMFVKRMPNEVQDILESNQDLCTPAKYLDKFKGNTPKCIGWKVRSILISNGLVPEHLFL